MSNQQHSGRAEPNGDLFDSEPPASEDVSGHVTLSGVHAAMLALTLQVHETQRMFSPLHKELFLMRQDFSALSKYVMGDQAPRITAVEKTAKDKAKVITIWGLSLTGIVGLAVQAASVFYPKLQGPLQTLLQLLNGAVQ